MWTDLLNPSAGILFAVINNGGLVGSSKAPLGALSSHLRSFFRSPLKKHRTMCPRGVNQLLILDERGAKTISSLGTSWRYESEIEWPYSTQHPTPPHPTPPPLQVNCG